MGTFLFLYTKIFLVVDEKQLPPSKDFFSSKIRLRRVLLPTPVFPKSSILICTGII
jgi:hypothetical protein